MAQLSKLSTTINRPFKCSLANCFESFADEKSLRKHKRNDPKHDYCYKCDLDFSCWDDLVKHKAESDKHLSCKYCGADFKSVPGIKRHIQIEHPISQRLPCPACGEEFLGPVEMISHLEHDKCKEVSASQFAGYVRHKRLLGQFLNDPEAFRVNQQPKMGNPNIVDAADEDGGVTLDDTSPSPGKIVDHIAKPTNYDMDSKRNDAKLELWPALPKQNSIQEEDPADDNSPIIDYPPLRSCIKGSIPPHKRNYAGAAKSTSPHMRFPSISTNSVTPSPKSEGSSYSSTTLVSTPESKTPSPAWCSENVSKKLFPEAKATPSALSWEEAETARLAEQEGPGGTNLFSSRAWDPFNSAFDPERFFNVTTEEYECPFRKICEKRFITPSDFEKHLILNHGSASNLSCPSCLKQFPSTTSLVAHANRPLASASSSCQLSHSPRFEKIIDEISGGFLSAYRTARNDVTLTVSRYGMQRSEGIGYVKFEATAPTGGLLIGRERREREIGGGVKLVPEEELGAGVRAARLDAFGGGVATSKKAKKVSFLRE